MGMSTEAGPARGVWPPLPDLLPICSAHGSLTHAYRHEAVEQIGALICSVVTHIGMSRERMPVLTLQSPLSM